MAGITSRILVVEDDDQTGLFMRHVLEREDYEVRIAANAEELREQLEGAAPAPAAWA